MDRWLFALNVVATVLCTFSFVIAVLVVNWHQMALQFSLAAANGFFAYDKYTRYKLEKSKETK